jgi:hypothetical protein
MWSDPSLHATVEGTVVFYKVCSEATTANATVGVFFVVCSPAITRKISYELVVGPSSSLQRRVAGEWILRYWNTGNE